MAKEYRLIRMRELVSIVGLAKSTIYEKIADGTFPPPIKISARASAWKSNQIENWMRNPTAYSQGDD